MLMLECLHCSHTQSTRIEEELGQVRLKETRSVTMNIFRKKNSFHSKSFVKIELS